MYIYAHLYLHTYAHTYIHTDTHTRWGGQIFYYLKCLDICRSPHKNQWPELELLSPIFLELGPGPSGLRFSHFQHRKGRLQSTARQETPLPMIQMQKKPKPFTVCLRIRSALIAYLQLVKANIKMHLQVCNIGVLSNKYMSYLMGKRTPELKNVK